MAPSSHQPLRNTFARRTEAPGYQAASSVTCLDDRFLVFLFQFGTDENIVLRSKEMAFYSWRSRNDLGRQDIHLCLEIEGECRWCEPFGIDSLGVVNRVVHYGLHSATLAIEVQKKSGLQRQVSFFVSYSMIVTMGVMWGGGGLRWVYVGVT